MLLIFEWSPHAICWATRRALYVAGFGVYAVYVSARAARLDPFGSMVLR